MGKGKHTRRVKFKRKDIARFLLYLRECMKWVVVLDDDGRPVSPQERDEPWTVSRATPMRVVGEDGDEGREGQPNIPPAILRALRVADEYTSGVNGDVGRLRDAVRAALSCVGGQSVSGEAPIATDLNTNLQRAADYDRGFALGYREGYDGPPVDGVLYPDEFERGREVGLKNREKYGPPPESEILAGSAALEPLDDSDLGERFLDCEVNSPPDNP